jgi:hypothetical protein
MPEIILEDDVQAKKEKEDQERLLKEAERQKKQHADWVACRHFKYIMSILDEEIRLARDVDTIPESATVEEIGQFALGMKVALKRLDRLKNRLS